MIEHRFHGGLPAGGEIAQNEHDHPVGIIGGSLEGRLQGGKRDEEIMQGIEETVGNEDVADGVGEENEISDGFERGEGVEEGDGGDEEGVEGIEDGLELNREKEKKTVR